MADGQDFDAAEFADRLSAMTDADLFERMQDLEDESEGVPSDQRDSSDVFARIAMVETAIEDRFPGELLAPYKGRGTATVIETLQDVIAKRRLAYDRDPDPAEDEVAEPSNDCPAAGHPPWTEQEYEMPETPDHPSVAETMKRLTRAQQDALKAIAFFRRQRRVGSS